LVFGLGRQQGLKDYASPLADLSARGMSGQDLARRGLALGGLALGGLALGGLALGCVLALLQRSAWRRAQGGSGGSARGRRSGSGP
jgi:hypothetical protein